MIPELSDGDWNEVFKYSDGFNIEDVVFSISQSDGYNDGDDWVGLFDLSISKYGVVRAGCDYTGWG